VNNIKIITLVCLGMLETAVPQAKADEWDQKTVFTFSGPVEIPGQVLNSGTYVFKLMDSQSTAVSSRCSTRTKITYTAHS